jgi:hypothetical protein
MEENKNQEQESQLSEAQIRQMRENMHNFYKQQIPLLKLQCQYEQLLADIEEARAKRLTMSIRIAQMMTIPEKESESQKQHEDKEKTQTNSDKSSVDKKEYEAPVTERKERKLKID